MTVAWYLARGFVVNVLVFFKRWYLDSWYFIFGFGRRATRRLERSLALRINIHFLFAPLYQERNIYGYVLGFLFRSFKIVSGSVAYLIILFLTLAVYVCWALIPLGLVYYALGYGY